MKIGLFVLLLVPLVFADSDIKKCARVALYSERQEILKNTSYIGLKIDPSGVIQSPGPTLVSKYLNSTTETKLIFKNNAEITFEKLHDRKIKAIQSNVTRRSTLTTDCKLDQTVINNKELLYDRKVCLEFADLYKKLGMSTKEVFACGDLVKSVVKLIENRNEELKNSGLSISKISDKNPLEVTGFVFSCADQLSFEKNEDGVMKGTIQAYTLKWLENAFSFSPTSERRSGSDSTTSVQ